MKCIYRQAIGLLACLLLSFCLQAQEKPKRDSIESKNDSIKIYKIIKEFSLKSKVTYWLYSFIFIDPDSTTQTLAGKPNKIKVNTNSLYAGKYIRNIEIITLDPFGIDINDTTPSVKFFQKAGNKLHIKSTRLNIRNQVLFDEGDKLDLLETKETERILRNAPYLRDAKVEIKPIKEAKDSIDVVIIVQDRWSINGSASASTSSSQVSLLENNFLGLAHQIENNVSYDFQNPSASALTLNGSYTVQNIKNTFITGRGFYSFTPTNNYKGISINRHFYSPLTKWAGGIDVMRSNSGNFTDLFRSSTTQTALKFDQQDYWIGKSFPVKSGKTGLDSRTAKFLITGRVFNIHYLKRPSTLDTINPYNNTTLYLSSIGFSTQRYYKDKYIFRFGEVEDVPEGRLFALLGGLENIELSMRYYAGIKIAFGNHIEKVGYFSAGLQYGGFFRNNKAEKGVMNFNLSFISELWNIEKWKIRSFIHYSYVHGINREVNERININNTNEMYGFNSPVLTGTDKRLLNIESVLYIPYNLLGFRFGTVVFAGLGMIGDHQNPVKNSKIYQAYGIGILIRNEHLVINTFRISFAFYPKIPGLAHPEFKYNPVSAYNLRFQNFFLSKPETIPYQ